MEVAPPPQKRLYMANMAFMANMTTTARWLNFKMTGCLMAVLGCTDVCWTALGFAGLYWAVNVVQVIQVIYMVTGQVGRDDWSGRVIRVVQVIQVVQVVQVVLVIQMIEVIQVIYVFRLVAVIRMVG